MPNEETEPAPVGTGADIVVTEDGLGKRFDGHATPNEQEPQQQDVVALLAADLRKPAQPAVRPIRRRAAPVLDRNLLTYRDDRYAALFAAVADQGHTIKLISTTLGPFVVYSRGSTIVLVEDDADSGVEAVNFDPASISAYARRCVGAILLTDERSPELYRMAAEMVSGRARHVLLIATRRERLDAWQRALRAAKPRLEIIVEVVHQIGEVM